MTTDFQTYPLTAAPEQARSKSGVARFVWVLAMFAAMIGGGFGFLGFVFANGAPQEASAAAVGSLAVIAPYCFARAVDELLRK